MGKHKIKVNQERCIGCGLCVKDCVAHNIVMKQEKASIIAHDCVMCGHCVAVCPQRAVAISGYEEKPVVIGQERRLDPEAVLDVIRFRRTIRQFQDTRIPDAVVRRILEAGRYTHTATNMQDVSYIVLDQEKDRMEQYAVDLFRKVKPVAGLFSSVARRNEIGKDFFFFQAPLVIVVVAKNMGNGYLAAQNMEFVAEAHGLGVLFSGFFSVAVNVSPKLRKALGIPKGKRVATTLVLGYPKVKYQRSAQREKVDVRYL